MDRKVSKKYIAEYLAPSLRIKTLSIPLTAQVYICLITSLPLPALQGWP